ncbi:DNA polymerase III subunit delta [Candidatus Saccharibacteria bacterium]|nr:DNA polymerase III subunit delta [Candidatus Saccharibacteria bacterium]
MIHILTGENDFELNRALKALVNEFVSEHGDLALERLDGEEITPSKLVDSANNLPFLASKKMIVVKGAANKDLLEEVTELDLPETTELIVVVPKIDKRASYYKKLSKMKGFMNFSNSSANQLPAWVIDTVKSQKGKISHSDAQYLVDVVGYNQMLLSSEMNKLITYDPEITKQTIDLLCEPTPQATVFQLLDAAFAGDIEKAQKLYREQRVQKVEPVAIMGLIAWQLHILATVKLAGDRSVNQIAKQAKLNPYVVQKSKRIADKMTLAKIKQLVSDALQLDIDMKSKNINADEAMMFYIAKISLEE